jgi:hypothetical protein
MDGIQTRVFCPDCGKEVELLLERQEVPKELSQIMKMLEVPVGGETAYRGQVECSCGKIVKISFIIEAFSKGDQSQKHIVFRGGF